MDKMHYEEMVRNLDDLEKEALLKDKAIYLFGHCNATEALIDLLIERGYKIHGILDNNISKHGTSYRNIPILPPDTILEANTEHTIVLIAARGYSSMAKQLKTFGFTGRIEKLVDYNSYRGYNQKKSAAYKARYYSETKIGKKVSGVFQNIMSFFGIGRRLFYHVIPAVFPEKKKDRKIYCLCYRTCLCRRSDVI